MNSSASSRAASRAVSLSFAPSSAIYSFRMIRMSVEPLINSPLLTPWANCPSSGAFSRGNTWGKSSSCSSAARQQTPSFAISSKSAVWSAISEKEPSSPVIRASSVSISPPFLSSRIYFFPAAGVNSSPWPSLSSSTIRKDLSFSRSAVS